MRSYDLKDNKCIHLGEEEKTLHDLKVYPCEEMNHNDHKYVLIQFEIS